MALLLFNSGAKQTVRPEIAEAIWEIKQGRPAATPEQQEYVDSIHMVYLNRHKAPQKYIQENKLLFDEMDGKLTNPWGTRARGN